jgi:dTDP-4-dehydrorhamnose 3,5-epimerase
VGRPLCDPHPITTGVVIMKFKELGIEGCYLMSIERIEDGRGFFARTFCKEELDGIGVRFDIRQCNISQNAKKGTIRGMHYQIAPYEEAKIVSCLRGRIFDVIIDLRRPSRTFHRSITVELDPHTYDSVIIPRGCAHGFQTLLDDSLVHYQMDQNYQPEAARGIRWNDPFLGVKWPVEDIIISDKDRTYGDYSG